MRSKTSFHFVDAVQRTALGRGRRTRRREMDCDKTVRSGETPSTAERRYMCAENHIYYFSHLRFALIVLLNCSCGAQRRAVQQPDCSLSRIELSRNRMHEHATRVTTRPQHIYITSPTLSGLRVCCIGGDCAGHGIFTYLLTYICDTFDEPSSPHNELRVSLTLQRTARCH